MMAEDSNVNLKWDAHQATLKSVFDTLLDTESLADCTVGAEGQHLKAHKVILSACSRYFELLFRHHHGKHIVIILPGAQFHILKALIQFMYCGEILIQQDELDALLKLADFLQVKGLSNGGNEVSEKKQTHKRRNKSPTYSEHTPSHCRVSPERHEHCDSPELLEVSGDSPQSEHFQEQAVTPISTPARKRKKSDWHPSREEASPQQYSVSPLRVVSRRFLLQRPEVSDKSASSHDMFSELEASSSVTSQLPVFSEGNFSAVMVSGHEVISAKPSNSLVKPSIFPTVSEKNTILDTFTEPKQHKCSDFNQDGVCDVILDRDDTQCQNLCDDKCVSTSELTQSSFCGDESFAQQIELQEAEWTNTEQDHQTSPTTRQFKCTSCDRSYKHSFNLIKHQIYDCVKEPQFQCPQCLFWFKDNHSLKAHMAKHNLQQ